MRSKSSHFTLGVWGLRACSLDVAQPSATGRNRSREVYGRASGECCKSGHFRRFQTCYATSFRVAGVVALCDIPTQCFTTCQKSLRVAGAILSRRFQKGTSIFRGRRSTLETSIVILRGRRSTSDASCYAFFVDRIASSVVAMCKRKHRTKHRF